MSWLSDQAHKFKRKRIFNFVKKKLQTLLSGFIGVKNYYPMLQKRSYIVSRLCALMV